MITEEYREQNRQLHENPHYGTSGSLWAKETASLYNKYGCTTVLDYGAGKCTLGKALPHLMIRNYDPCIEGMDDPPAPADLVVCGDVMEHIEEQYVDDVLDHIQTLARKVVFFVIATYPAQKTLPDGRNAHITVRSTNWWIEQLLRRWSLRSVQMITVGKDGIERFSLNCTAVPIKEEVTQ